MEVMHQTKQESKVDFVWNCK